MSKVKVNGIWRDIQSISAKINGNWNPVSTGYTKVNGVWESFYTLVPGFAYNNVITNSCMFDSVTTTVLNRTNIDEHGQTFTLSIWVKQTSLGANRTFFEQSQNASNHSVFLLNASDQLMYYKWNSGITDSIVSNAVFRDCSGWYHFMLSYDSTQATEANRIKLYANNEELSLGTANYPNQNDYSYFFSDTYTPMGIGYNRVTSNEYFDGYMAEFIGVGGSQLTPSSFGETVSGIWIPKTFAGAYGDGGFHLGFSDNTHFGDDNSGNANDFTDVNLGTDHQMLDTPENNYCTLDINNTRSNITTFRDGGLYIGNSGSSWETACGIFLMKTGKWYFEVNVQGDAETTVAGIVAAGEISGDIIASDVGFQNTSYGYGIRCNLASSVFKKVVGGVETADTNLPVPANYDIMMIAFDADANKIWFGVDGTWGDWGGGVGDPANGTNPSFDSGDGIDSNLYDYIPAVAMFLQNDTLVNFGQRTFAHTPPAGFKALCSENLPEPSMIEPDTEAFNTITWSGDDNNPRSLTGVGFRPDFVWLKNRNNTANHMLTDVIREAGADAIIYPNLANAAIQTPINGTIISLDADGFTVDAGGTGDINVNDGARTYVAWCFKKNPAYGFDIVTYEGTGSAHAENHSLGAIPELIIVKNLPDVQGWGVYHKAALNKTDPETDYGALDSSQVWNDADSLWNDTVPTDTQFTVGTANRSNKDNTQYIAYLFASISGFSHIFSFEGNGNAAGPYVYCGFRPAWIILKNVDAIQNWNMRDTIRDLYNPSTKALWPNLTTAETGTSADVDIYANGFKLRHVNFANNQTYVGIAIAEQPFKYANAR